jgi:hypothetical protein
MSTDSKQWTVRAYLGGEGVQVDVYVADGVPAWTMRRMSPVSN